MNGAKLYIGGPTSAKAADHVEADFDGVTWVEIDGWQSCGALNDDTQTITTSLINRPRDSNSKGTKNAAPTEMIFAVLPEDPGQEDLYEADASRFNYNFRIVWDDAPATVGEILAPLLGRDSPRAVEVRPAGRDDTIIWTRGATRIRGVVYY